MLVWGIVIALALAAVLLVPYLMKTLDRGETRLKPGTPAGAGDVKPGTRGDPAPGQPEAQADPWSPQAHRP